MSQKVEPLVLISKAEAGQLTVPHSSEALDPKKSYVAFRCTAVPSHNLNLRGIAKKLSGNYLNIIGIIGKNLSTPIFGQGVLNWKPMAHGAKAFAENNSIWTIRDDGSVSIVGIFIILNMPSEFSKKYYPSDFLQPCIQILLIEDFLRRSSGRPDVNFVIDCELRHNGSARAMIERHGIFLEGSFDEKVQIGPFTVGSRTEILDVIQEIKQEIWHGFGLINREPENIDYEATLQAYLAMPL